MMFIDLTVYAAFLMVFFAIITLITASAVCHLITVGLSALVLIGMLLHAFID